MIVLLSNTPFNSLRKLIDRHQSRSLVYLGSNQKIVDQLGLLKQNSINVLDYARELYEVSEIKRKSFVDWIDQISSQAQDSLEWFFSPSAVKNPYASDLYLNICYFYVLKQLMSKQKIDVVLVDSPALLELIRAHWKSKSESNLLDFRALWAWRIKKFILFWLRLFRFTWESVRKYLAIKFILRRRLSQIKELKDSVLIRTYIGADFSSTDPGIMEKHYFPGLYDYFKKCNLNAVYFPICLTVSSFSTTFQRVKDSKFNIILPEEFLRFYDFGYAWTTWARGLRTKLTIDLLEGVNFSNLLKEEFISTLTERGLLGAMLLSRVGERMKEQGIIPKSMINWYENQAIEKGLAKGLRQSFPNIRIIGSQSLFVAPNHVSLFPSRQDRENKVVPDKILVLGDAGNKLVNQYLPNLSVNYSLPFRYQKILEASNNKGRVESGHLLVLLSYGLADSINIVRTLLEKLEQLKVFKKVVIKLHPAGYFNQKQLMLKLGRALPDGWEFIAGSLEQCLDNVSVGVSGATGAAVNVIAYGIPAVVIAQKNMLTMNYLATTVDRDLWRLCFNSNEVLDALYYFRSKNSLTVDQLHQKGQKLVQNYFGAPNEKYWENYLF